jgi:hypothetical protein
MLPAFVHAGLGEWDESLEWIERAIDARDPHVVPIKSMFMVDPIRDDPRFKNLLVKMKLA